MKPTDNFIPCPVYFNTNNKTKLIKEAGQKRKKAATLKLFNIQPAVIDM